jgi:hypothetical protein
MGQTTPPFEQLRGGVLLARFVFAPREVAVATRLLLLDVALHVSGALIWSEAGEDEYGFDAQFFERSEVALDACGQTEGKATGSGQERLVHRWIFVERLEIIGGINAQAGVGEGIEGKRLKVLPLLKVR